MPKTQSSSSTETILVPITARRLGQAYDPSGDTVKMAFLPVGQDPTAPDEHAASWQVWPGPVFYAACLVGPVGGVVLVRGQWVVWVKITDSPDVPWLHADLLSISP